MKFKYEYKEEFVPLMGKTVISVVLTDNESSQVAKDTKYFKGALSRGEVQNELDLMYDEAKKVLEKK